MKESTSIKAFLSHRYKSPKINLYFFDLIQKYAEVQFEIDEGSFSTNVTRLERMINDSNVFIGIFPIAEELGKNPAKIDIEKSCRYFKLELDIASRQKKPTLCIIDKRYGNTFEVSDSSFTIYYDSEEIVSEGGYPNKQYFESIIQSFFNSTRKVLEYQNSKKSRINQVRNIIIYRDEVNTELDAILTPQNLNSFKDAIEKYFLKDIIIKDPPKYLNERFYREIKSAEFVVINLAINEQLSIFLHAEGVPQLRICSQKELSKFLFGQFSVGYPKDIIKAITIEDIIKEFKERLITIKSPVIRINTHENAKSYFKKASLRKEAIFVSYSGEDEQIAVEIIKKLKERFALVFNYRDKAESILPGRPWLKEIFDSLAKSSLGIVLFSKSYFESENCQHELRQLIAMQDSKKISVLPIKLHNNKTLDLPNFAQDLQYIRYWDYENQDEIIKSAERLIDITQNKQ